MEVVATMKGGADNQGKKGACSIVAASAGLILGYHLAQTCGVVSFIPEVGQLYWDGKEGAEAADSTYIQILPLFTSAAFLVALYCCPLASYVTRACGRRPVLITGAAYFVVGSLVSAFSREIQVFIFGRILLAVGVSLVNQSASVYLSEMAPYRGPSVNIMFQLAITVGIIVANIVNYNYDTLHRPWVVGGAVVPGFILLVSAVVLHDTPNSLIERNQLEEAERTLKTIQGTSDVAQELSKLVAASDASNLITSPWVKLLHDSKYRPQLVFVTAVQLFQSFTPITWAMFFAPWLLVTPSMDASLLVREICMPALLISVVNVLQIFLGVYAVNCLRKRSIFILRPWQMFILLTVVGAMTIGRFGVGGIAILSNVYAGVVVACICNNIPSYTASFRPFANIGIFSPKVQSGAQNVHLAAHIICVHVIMQFFVWSLCKLKFGLFFGFSFIYLGMSLFKWLRI